jgi:catalase (peroxidase I)
MTVEVALLISGVSLAFALYQGITNMKRNKTQDDKQDASQLTTVIVKLENIGEGVNEIKSDMKGVKEDVVELRERIVAVEQSAKSAHHRVDLLERVCGGEHDEK